MRNRKLWVSILAGVLAFVLVFGLVAGVLPSLVGAAKSSSELKSQLDSLKADKKKIEKEIAALEDKLSDNLDSMEEIVEQKNTIDQQIFMLHEKITNLNEQISAYGNLIADKQEELDIAQAHLAELNRKNKERIRAMEENGSLSYWSVLFKANSFADLLDRLNMVEEIAASDRRRLQEMSEAAAVVEQAKAELETEKAALEENKLVLDESQKEMEAKREEADKLLADLIATGEEYQKLIDAAESDVSDLEDDIDAAQDAYDEAKRQEWLATSKPSTSNSSSGSISTPSGGKWLVPCKYTRFSSPFGWRIHPVYKDWRFHKGVDLGAPRGTDIVATRSGTVVFAKWDNSAGYYVKIDHGDGFASIYMHMTHYIVKAGDKVTAGQKIGEVGSTGTSTGNHLHFGIQYKGSYVNPANYINI
ncbi:MAG: peptidoglycan DD-metalloendopeptidase family protein [Oscillospiraceae bacterium]|nr:peptidoglycan DD-metalloendopeptidase family protein [Oscillospiraceae bacterium]